MRQAEVTPPSPAPPSPPSPGPMLQQARSKSPNGPMPQPRQTIPNVPSQHLPSLSLPQELSPGPACHQTRSKSPNGPMLQPQQTTPNVPSRRLQSDPPSPDPVTTPQQPSPACSATPLSPREDQPRSGSIEPTATNDPSHLGRAPPPAGTFAFAGTAPFITSAAIRYLQTIPAGQRWVDMIVSYLRLEEAPISKGVSIPLSFQFYLY